MLRLKLRVDPCFKMNLAASSEVYIRCSSVSLSSSSMWRGRDEKYAVFIAIVSTRISVRQQG